MNRLFRNTLALGALALVGLGNAAKAQSQATIIELPPLTYGLNSYAYAINASGQITGIGNIQDIPPYAMRWTGATAGAITTELFSLDGSLKGTYSFGSGINDSGQVAGWSSISRDNIIEHAVVWTGTTPFDLGTLGSMGSSSRASGINNRGQVVGFYWDASNSTNHAFLYSNAKMVDLGTLGLSSSNSQGVAINDNGEVAGFSETVVANMFVGTHAFRYSGASLIDLGTLPPEKPNQINSNSTANGINSHGIIVGSSDAGINAAGDVITHAVYWTGTTIADLGALGGKDTNSHAYGINSQGDIVGDSQPDPNSTDSAPGAHNSFTGSWNGYVATLHTAGGQTIDLNSLLPATSGWLLMDARAINDRGWIIGNGLYAKPPYDPPHNVQYAHGYLLIPGGLPNSTVTGTVALEGVSDLAAADTTAHPLGNFDIQFRAPGTKTVIFENKAVTLTTTSGSPNGAYSITGVSAGTYDVWIKSSKNLAVLVPGVVVSATGGSIPGVMLNGGDVNNDNSCDASDFGPFVSAYNTSSSVPGSGYDSNTDFNYDGSVDAVDFGMLVENYNTQGAP